MIAVVVFLIVICAAMYRTNVRREEIRRINKLKSNFGHVPDKRMSPERYENVSAYYVRHKTDHSIDDITWNDLDLTALYHRIDSTQSAAGEEYLYYLLRTPAQDAAEGAELVDQSAVQYFAADENAGPRIRIQRILAGTGHTGRYSLYDYLDRLDTLGERSNVRNYICCLLPLVSILVIVAIHVRIGIVLLVASLCYNLVTYYKEKGEIDPYIVSFRYLLRLMDTADRLGSVSCPVLYEDCKALQTANETFRAFRRGSGIVMSRAEISSGNPVDLALDYLRILFHLDLIKFNMMLRAVRTGRTQIDEMLRIVGRIDAEIAAASFRNSLPHCCDPLFAPSEEGIQLDVQELIHPLLASPVPNSIDVQRSILLTGSNASGKSTFLKSVAIAALLSQSLGVVPASHYHAPRWRIYSSMALRDSMQDGDSYFMVEIKSLKRIVDAAAVTGVNPVLCCIDEVLRGTNTIERIAASSEILGDLDAGHRVLCIAATHDGELTGLLTGYCNYHFEEDMQGDDVVFSYRIREGRATTCNAIRLLSQIGFDPSMTQRAKERAARFEETGVWQ